MNYMTVIDTVGLQIDCDEANIQREILFELLNFIREATSLYIGHKDYLVGMNENIIRREHHIYSNNSKKVATVNTGSFRAGSYSGNGYTMKYYINIKFAGLKKYDEILDAVSQDCLFTTCAFLNSMGIQWKLTELDIGIDAACEFNHMLAICMQKSPKTQYYGITEKQNYTTTTYIEKITADKLDKAVLRAYLYDKSHKEHLDNAITRFELKLQPKFFNKHGFNVWYLENTLARYYVMYFEDIEIKNTKIEAYNSYQTVRKRELKRLGFDTYRLYANMNTISNFIHRMCNIYIHPLFPQQKFYIN